MYTPFFHCEFCGKAIKAQVSGSSTILGMAHAMLPACTCTDSLKKSEQEHRELMERRKRLRGRRGR